LTDVAVAVVERLIDAGVRSVFLTGGQQSADSARALEAARKIGPPEPGFIQSHGRGGPAGVYVSCELGNKVPAIVKPIGALAAFGAGEAAAETVVVKLDGGAAGGRDLDELVLTIPDEGGIRGGNEGDWAGGHVPIQIVGRAQGADGVILIERVGRVGFGGAAGGGVGAVAVFAAVADAIESVVAGAGAGVDVLGGNELAARVIEPVPIRRGGEGADRGGGGDRIALTDGIHAIVILRYGGRANLVLFPIERVAVGQPLIVHGVDGTGDGVDEVGISLVEISVGACAAGEIAGDGKQPVIAGPVSLDTEMNLAAKERKDRKNRDLRATLSLFSHTFPVSSGISPNF
jgi:hypothetical protein